MKHYGLKIILVLLLFGLKGLHASEVAQDTTLAAVLTAGGDAIGNDGHSMGYSIGQVVYTTSSKDNNGVDIVAEGIQQPPYEITIKTAIEDALGINLMINAYPNPTTDFLILSVDDSEFTKLSYRLYDISGQLLESQMIRDRRTSIPMSKFQPATYFLKVIQNDKSQTQEIKTFKIIKN